MERRHGLHHGGHIADAETMLSKQKKLEGYEIKLDTNKSKYEKELEFYHNNDTCPTCKQDMDAVFKQVETHVCQKKIEEINQGLEKLEEEKNAVLQRINHIRKTNADISNLQADISKHSISISHLQKRNASILREIEELENSKSISGESKVQSELLIKELTELVDKKKTEVK